MAIFIYIGVAYISIFIHELGHYLSAYLFGVKATDVVTGMGICLFKIKMKHTTFTFKCFPGGGMTTYTEGDLDRLNPIQSIIMLASGVFLNYITAIVAMSIHRQTTLIEGLKVLNQTAGDFIMNLVQMLQFKDLFFPETTLNESIQHIASDTSTMSFVIFLFIFMNLILFLFNLLPIPFFDGGQIIGIVFDPILLKLGLSETRLEQFKSIFNRLIGFILIMIVMMPFISHFYYKLIRSSQPLKIMIEYALVIVLFILINRLFKKKAI
ncbi:MAG: site-2 protease family protein [Turicibacter sp.]